MSLKTEEIKKSLNNLDLLNKQLKNYTKNNYSQKLDDIQFGIETNTKNLRTWIEMLYKYNGKSKSNKKITASRINGKKGGRPKKEIAEARKRITELEINLIPELKARIEQSYNSEETIKLAAEKTSYEIELAELKEKLNISQ